MNTQDTPRHRNPPVPSAVRYEFRVAGHLDDEWSAWFDNLTISRHPDGTSTLTGPVTDQAHLHGILARLRDLGGTLLSVQAQTHDTEGECGATEDP
jgi:hypothetical protein